MLTAHGVSHPGRVRKINEDSWRSEPDLGLFLVADGMGGHNAGEVASKLAVEAIGSFMRRTHEGDDVTWPYGLDPKLSFPANRLLTAIKLANRRVFKAGETRDEYTGMGTTVVAALVDAGQLIFAGVGDSRLYLFTGGRLIQLTTDDSWVATLQSQEPSAETPSGKHPLRHVLTNVVGAREQVDLHVIERPLLPDEMLLLCSDGLHVEVDDSSIAKILGGSADASAAAERLVQAALEQRAADNITALAVQYRAD